MKAVSCSCIFHDLALALFVHMSCNVFVHIYTVYFSSQKLKGKEQCLMLHVCTGPITRDCRAVSNGSRPKFRTKCGPKILIIKN